jgi:peptidyl-prolyl cis-trans isomerase C
MPAPASHRAIVVRRHRLLWGGVLAVLLLAGCGKKESQPEPGVLAKGDGWTVRSDDFRHWWSTRPGPADSPQARTEALDRLVERATLAAAARQAGLERDPETAAQIESLLIARLQEVRLAPQLAAVKVSDDEVRARYDAQRASAYTQPEAVRVALLWFNTRGQQPLVDRYRPRLERIRAEVTAGGDQFPVAAGFGPAAVGNTEHKPSRLIGGDLGWLELAPGNDPWRKAVLELAAPLKKPGDLSDIMACKDGLFLLRLIERRSAKVQPFEAVNAEIRRGLVEQRRQSLQEDFTRRVLSTERAERFPEALAAVADLPPRGGARAPGPVPTAQPAKTPKTPKPPANAPLKPKRT